MKQVCSNVAEPGLRLSNIHVVEVFGPSDYCSCLRQFCAEKRVDQSSTSSSKLFDISPIFIEFVLKVLMLIPKVLLHESGCP